MSQQVRVRSRWWYLLPIFFNIVGGAIAYFILRDDDPQKAKNCLWLGIVLIAIKIGLFVIFISICTSIEPCGEFHDEFMSGMEGFMGQEDLMTQTQLMQQLMMQSPEHRQQMLDSLTQDPEDMRGWMANSPHIQQMGQVMGENHDFMMEMMSEIMDDPDLRLQMVAHMTENPEAMQMMMQIIGSDGTMMHSGSMISPGLMEKGMMQDQEFLQQMQIMMQNQTMRHQMMNQMMQDPQFMQELMQNQEFMRYMMNP